MDGREVAMSGMSEMKIRKKQCGDLPGRKCQLPGIGVWRVSTKHGNQAWSVHRRRMTLWRF